MMKRMKLGILAGMIALSFLGCQSTGDNKINGSISESDVKEESLFENLEHVEFYFSSGAGGWRTVLTIQEDGSFSGEFSDSDMGSQTYYVSNFEGKFTEPVKVNDYTYSMQIKELQYAEEVGKEVLKDGIYYSYTDAYGIANAEEILLYLPGAPLEELPEGYKSWVNTQIRAEGENLAELPFYGLYNVTEECGFSSYDYVENLHTFIADQQELAVSLEETLMHENLNQVELNELSYQIFELWDAVLNEEWSVLKQLLEEDTMNDLLKDQREWIKYKENVVQDVVTETGGGSITPLLANQRAADLTKFRVYELLDYVTYGDAAADKTYYSGCYVDTQGTQEIYSELYLSYVGEDKYETHMYLYRSGELKGISTLDKDKLLFVDEDLKVEGELVIQDKKVVFKIKKSEFEPLAKGDMFQFQKSY